MAIPSWSTCRIYGTWTDAGGTRLAGRAVTSISARVTNVYDDLIIPAGSYPPGCVDLNVVDPTKAALDFQAPATDDPDIPEDGWQIKIVVSFSNHQIKDETYILSTVPSNGVIDLRTIVPVTSTPISFGTAGFKVGIPGGVPLLNSDMQLVDAMGNTIATAPDTGTGTATFPDAIFSSLLA